MMRTGWIAFLLVMSGVFNGCHSVGPSMIERDQFDYNTAVANSWNEQMLLNMVRLRYGEAPVFLDVASVITQYSLETQVSLTSPGWDRPNNVGPPIAGGAARWIDRPTITYQPRTGQTLSRMLLRPVSLSAIFSLVQAGWPIDITLIVTLRSINGMDAYSGQRDEQWNPDFLRAVQALHAMPQLRAGGVVMAADKPYYQLNQNVTSKDIQAAQEELREALGLDRDVSEYEILVSPQPTSTRQIALSTASTLDVLSLVASRFDVPQEHVALGLTFATPVINQQFRGKRMSPPIRVHSGDKLPERAFVAARNRGTWFWIEDGDLESKRVFSFLTMLMALSEASNGPSPLVTIGAGG